MQHGGVVAREYGKACVVGNEHVLTLFRDGQRVEVDGNSGRVSLLNQDETASPADAKAADET
jgi:pyruvate,water dikinase